jgi:tripartite-type tricarboxylate transporter receptor subunit TctC
MSLLRRQFLGLAAGAVALAAASLAALAQTYPSRPVRVIVPFAPGGTTDMVARLIAQRLWERLGQQFTVENRPGASTNIATQAVVRAPADGYTLLIVPPPSAINATFYKRLQFNFMRDIAPIAAVMHAPYVMEINPSVPAKTVPEFIGYVKAHPGTISMASAGVGTTPHLTGELFKLMTGVDMTHVPYRGGAPALTDLLAGQVQLYFASAPETIEYIKAGSVRPLAVTAATRLEVLADLPLLSSFLPGFEASYWVGFGAPRDTPAQILDKLNREINIALGDPVMKSRLAVLGATETPGSADDFAALIAAETQKWGEIVRHLDIKAE